MNLAVYVWECIVLCLAFGTLTQMMLLMNPVSFISDYPLEIQNRYYASQHKEAVRKKITRWMIVKKLLACIFFLFVFAWMAHMAGAVTFCQGLAAFYGYTLVLCLFDTLFLDFVLFANSKKIRLPGTEDMDREYHQKWFHVKACIPMIPVFLVGGVLGAQLMVMIW